MCTITIWELQAVLFYMEGNSGVSNADVDTF